MEHQYHTHAVDREYTSVCGRIKAYESGFHIAFGQYHTLDSNAYVSGVSLTHGGDLGNSSGTNATHIWSFTAGNNPDFLCDHCPCDNGTAAPPFVGED